MVLNCDNYLDLPALNAIYCENGGSHQYTGYVILESRTQSGNYISLDRYPKSHGRQHPIWGQCVCIYSYNYLHQYVYCNHLYDVDAPGLSNFIHNKSRYHPNIQELQDTNFSLVTSDQSLSTIPSTVNHLTFYNYNPPNLTEFSSSHQFFNQLKILDIRSNCLTHARDFVLKELPNLEKVVIGNGCFKTNKIQRANGHFQISNCPNLRQLSIGDSSFYDFTSFELTHMQSLQSIELSYYCFQSTERFVLQGKELKEMYFYYVYKCVMT